MKYAQLDYADEYVQVKLWLQRRPDSASTARDDLQEDADPDDGAAEFHKLETRHARRRQYVRFQTCVEQGSSRFWGLHRRVAGARGSPVATASFYTRN